MGFHDAVERAVQGANLKIGCDKCTLDRSLYVPSKMVPGAQITVVSGWPTHRDVQNQEVFSGDAGRLIKNLFRDVGLDPDACNWVNVVKCGVGEGEAVSDKVIQVCGDRNLKMELSGVESKILILMGNVPFGYLFKKDELSKSQGNFRRLGKFTVMTTWPAISPYQLGGPDSELGSKRVAAIRRDIDKVRRYLDGTLYSDQDYTLIKTPKEASEWADFLCNQPLLSSDIETTTLRPWHPGSELLMIAFSWAKRKAVCFPVDHFEIVDEQFKEASRQAIRRVLESSGCNTWHHMKFDNPWLTYHGYRINGPQYCTMIMAHLVDENRRSYGLKQLTAEELEGYRSIVDPKPHTPLEDFWRYNCEDSDNGLQLFDLLKKRMNSRLWWVHDNIVIPGSLALAEAERVGVRVDLDRVRALLQDLGAELRQKVAEANRQMLPGRTVTSSKDLADHLFTRMGYPVISTTKKGTRQVDEAVLVALRDEHNCELAGDVLKIRELEKLTTTYLTPYPKLVEPDGRIHCFFNTTRTVTGRLSSDSPNLQNVPRDKRIRTLFVSSPGWGFLYGDLSNAEMRIAACLSRDPALVEAFRNDVDVHVLTASAVLDIPMDQVTKDQRQKAKPVNFGFLYGQQAKGFVSYAKTQYGVVFAEEEAERTRSKYFIQYRGLTPWYREVTDEMYRYEMIYTDFGRGRRFPGVRSMDRASQMRCERQAINTKVQSLAGELTTMIVAATQQYVQREGMRSRVVLTVHDSIMVDGPWDELPKVARFIYEYVKNLDYTWLRVPMKIDLEMGEKMGDTKPIKEGVDF